MTNGTKSIEQILSAYKIILEKQRAILVLANEIGDEGTSALMSNYIRVEEKNIWI